MKNINYLILKNCSNKSLEEVSKKLYLVEETRKHCLNVALITKQFVSSLKSFEENEVIQITIAALYHDIGKNNIDANILYKKGSFTNEEFEKVKKHVYVNEKYPTFIKNVIEQHHEKINMKGYRGLKSGQISMYSKIVSLVDTYEALTAVRCYKSSKTKEETIEIIQNDLGISFDKILGQKFLNFVQNNL